MRGCRGSACENKKPRRGARRVAMRPLMFVLLASQKIQTWTTKNARGYQLFYRANYQVQRVQYADECPWCKIPGRPAASSAAMRATTSAKVALGGGLEVERSNRAPCFALDLDEQLKVHPASPASTRARTASAAVVNSAALRTWTSCSSDTAARPPSASRKVATPARLRAMAARERH